MGIMSYKIAVASSDGINVDLSFGEAKNLMIYNVQGEEYTLSETRESIAPPAAEKSAVGERCRGCAPAATGCGGRTKAEIVSDCRCVICKSAGFNVRKQFEKSAVSCFDVECTIAEALDKITRYFSRVDGHISLKNFK